MKAESSAGSSGTHLHVHVTSSVVCGWPPPRPSTCYDADHTAAIPKVEPELLNSCEERYRGIGRGRPGGCTQPPGRYRLVRGCSRACGAITAPAWARAVGSRLAFTRLATTVMDKITPMTISDTGVSTSGTRGVSWWAQCRISFTPMNPSTTANPVER